MAEQKSRSQGGEAGAQTVGLRGVRGSEAGGQGGGGREGGEGGSALGEALVRVGDRWTLLVVEALLGGPRRFSDLLGEIGGIAANILSERLKRLERDGLVVARPYSRRPPRSEYELTGEGQELAGALLLLAHWGARHADPAQAPRHAACGTPIEPRWYCPTCDRLVDHEPRHAEALFV